MHQIDIFRAGTLFVSVKIDDKSSSTQTKTIMGENFIGFQFDLNFFASFKPGDYCEVFGETYKLNETPAVTKESKFKYHYTIKMQSEGSDLAKVQFLFLGSDNTLKESDFSLMGTAQTFLNLILQNSNRVLSGWSLGEVITTDYKNLTFSSDTCLSALAKIAEAFKTEYWLIGKTIHLTKVANDAGITFKHGKGKGLYEIQRQQTSGSSVITRLYPYGSDKNLPSDYGSQKLRLRVISIYAISNLTCVVTDVGGGQSNFNFSFTPATDPSVTALTISRRLAGTNDPWINSTGSPSSPRSLVIDSGTYEFMFTSLPIGVSTSIVTIGSTILTPLLSGFPQPFIENNTDQFGIIEYVQTFDDVYPHRTGTLSAVDATDVYKFRDAAIDFDINSQLLPGLTPKVVFNTGQLSGYSFEIKSFNNTTKEFTILKNKDETSLDIPSTSLKPAIGDKYVLVDIKMPDVYITTAENELLAKAQDMIARFSLPQYTYNIVLDPVFIRNHGYTINIGDEVWITDSDLEVNRKIRVINTVRNIVVEEQYQLQLSDSVSQGTISQINNNIQGAQQGVNQLSGQLQNAAIFNGKVIGDLKLEQGTVIMPDIPSTTTTTGFEQIYREISTGKLFRKV
jgi:hypothetical protein